MTQEEKAICYDKALERAKNLHKDAIDMGDSIRAKQCEIIFPELKKNEDERISEALIALLKFGLEDGSAIAPGFNETKEQALAWLEKQGEQKPNEWSEEDEKHIDSLLKRLDGLCRNEFERTRFAISEDEDWLKSLKERIGE